MTQSFLINESSLEDVMRKVFSLDNISANGTEKAKEIIENMLEHLNLKSLLVEKVSSEKPYSSDWYIYTYTLKGIDYITVKDFMSDCKKLQDFIKKNRDKNYD